MLSNRIRLKYIAASNVVMFIDSSSYNQHIPEELNQDDSFTSEAKSQVFH